ncbi:MAG: HAMP domain-containing protein [Actinobacteria bacterium]|nr:HAMP domain-containing protein [Actinomycetota bacterium]
MTIGVAHRISLRWRVTLIASLLSLALFTCGSLLLYHDLSGRLSAAIDAELDVRLDDLEASLGGTQSGDDDAFLRSQVIGVDGSVEEPPGSAPMLTSGEIERARAGPIVIERTVAGVGTTARVSARPVEVSGGTRVAVAAASTRPLQTARDRLRRTLAVFGPLIAAAIGAGAWILTGAVLRPVEEMALGAATISASSTGRRLPEIAGSDELAVLARTLNSMLDRIGDAVAHERTFIDDAAHELRTPLAILRGELELAALDVTDHDAVEESLGGALAETDRLVALTTDLLILARSDAGQLEPQPGAIDVGATVVEVVRHLPAHDGIRVEAVDASDGALALADALWVRQMVTNLVGNAQRYAASAVRVSIDATATSVEVSVADDGGGVAPASIPTLFDRFSRASQARNLTGITSGFGLGLAITATLAEAQGGTIGVTNGPPLGGACFTMRFQAVGPEPTDASER